MKKKNSEKSIMKNTKKIDRKIVEYCKQELLKKYNELTNLNLKERDILPEVGDDIDIARMTLDKEILHELTDTQRNLLELIEIALEKIEKDEFSICESCKKTIPAKRIKAIPWARYCITCQTNIEKK